MAMGRPKKNKRFKPFTANKMRKRYPAKKLKKTRENIDQTINLFIFSNYFGKILLSQLLKL